MGKVISIVSNILVFVLLTILTQTGGLVMLLTLFLFHFFGKTINSRILRVIAKSGLFVVLYLIFTFAIIPVLAAAMGRVALPVTNDGPLRPLNKLTCLLNRHYVRHDLLRAALDVAKKIETKYPGTVVNYLDAGFPFINGFPLVPHLSHNDGKKLDVSFYYISNETNEQVNLSPSFIGYGVCEEPKAGEVDTPGSCKKKGYWQYSLLTKLVSQHDKMKYRFDEERTKALVLLFEADQSIGKIFIEPHLKQRLHLTSNKIRFHGCRAVRHDDHLHVQLK